MQEFLSSTESSLISIIVPFYNAEKYLKRCVQSVIAQTHESIELLLVNDGSSDDSLQLANSLATVDARICVFTQKNAGVSAARNLGLKAARGQFVYFLDADDFLEANAIEALLEEIDTSIDIVMGNYFKYTNDAKVRNVSIKPQVIRDINDLTPSQLFDLFFYKGAGPQCWNKLFRREFLLRNKIVFNENIAIGEDTLFNITAYSMANVIAVVNKYTYNYVYRSDSVIATYKRDLLRQFKEILTNVNSLDLSLAVTTKRAILSYYCISMLDTVASNELSKENSLEVVKRIVDSFMKNTVFETIVQDARNRRYFKEVSVKNWRWYALSVSLFLKWKKCSLASWLVFMKYRIKQHWFRAK